jgi:hypothetical protein
MWFCMEDVIPCFLHASPHVATLVAFFVKEGKITTCFSSLPLCKSAYIFDEINNATILFNCC